MDRSSSRPCGNVETRVVCGFPSSEGAARKADPNSALAPSERHSHRESSVSAHFRENLLVWHPVEAKGTASRNPHEHCMVYRFLLRANFITLDPRIELFLSLPLANLDKLAIKKAVDRIGGE